MTDDKRRFRRETRMLQNESSWLQKALFALRKVEEVHDRLAELNDEEPVPYSLELGGEKVRLEAVEDAIERRAADLQGRVRERRRGAM